MPKIFFDAIKLGINKSTPYYISGQELLNPEEEDVTRRQYETWQIELKNGENEVSDRAIGMIRNHVDADYYFSSAVISIDDTPVQDTDPPIDDKPPSKDVFKLSVKDATPIIKAETNIEMLKQWEADTRTTIKDLVGDRLLELGKMPNV